MARIITPEAILSYPNLFVPRAAQEGGTEKFSAALVFPEGTDTTELKKAAIAAAQEKWGDRLKGAKIKALETQHGYQTFLVAGEFRALLPWRDHPETIATKGYPEGSTFINARSTRKPGIVTVYQGPDGKPLPLDDESKVYAGVIVKASVDAYAYEHSGNKGVAFGLGNIQIIRDGERLDGSVAAQDEFEADPDAVADLSDLTEDDSAEVLAGVTADDGDDLSDLLG